MIWLLVCWEHITVITTAPTRRQVAGILWREIHATIEASPVEVGGELLALSLTLTSKRFAFGQSSSISDPTRFQGWHNAVVVAIVDEAAGIPPGIYDAIEGTTTGESDLVLELGNPTDATSRFCTDLEKEITRTIKREVEETIDTEGHVEAYRISSWEAAEWNANQKKPDRLPGLVSRAWCERKADPIEGWGESSPAYQARVLGHVAHEDTTSLIKLAWIEAAFYRYQEARWECDVVGCRLQERNAEETVIGLDVARHGGDRCTWCIRQDADLVYFETWENTDDDDALVQVADRTVKLVEEWGAQGVVIDATGMGWGVHDMLRRRRIACVPVQFGSKAMRQDRFHDRRSELWWNLRQWLLDGEGSLPEWDDLLRDLLLPSYKWVSDRTKGSDRFRLESKDAMRRRIARDAERGSPVRSTDLGDAAALSLESVLGVTVFGLKKERAAEANPAGRGRRRRVRTTDDFVGRLAA